MSTTNDMMDMGDGARPGGSVGTVTTRHRADFGESPSHKNMILLIQLRWIAVAGQIATIAVVEYWFHIALPIEAMAAVLAALVIFNLASLWWVSNRTEVDDRGLLVSLVLDVLALSVQLYLSGGASNPFVFLYILQVTIAAVLLDARATWQVALLTFVCAIALVPLNVPLILPAAAGTDLFTLHVAGTMVCLALDAALLVVFITRINRNLRERDSHLADLRQRAAEEDHIVRMGLLASGAAHELGTPLSSLSVILGDWQHLPRLAGDPELNEDVAEMQAAVARCKAILSGILISAGEARGDAPTVTTVNAFLDGLAADWRAARSATGFKYQNIFDPDLPIVSDTALRQVVFNVLDNAFEASPGWLSFTAERADDKLVLRVADAGPGFAEEMLTQFGKPYASSKGRAGGGLGLFLVVNVVRKLGGTVVAGNRINRGALVTIELPLAMLAIEEPEHVG